MPHSPRHPTKGFILSGQSFMIFVSPIAGTMYDGRVVTMEYKAASTADVELYLVGKGIIFDTGGLSLKTGSSMSFMHSDKCGAAGITGFMKVVSLLKPQKLSVHTKLAYVRNNIGSDAYAVDEIIPSRRKITSLIGSTDAEGRNVMVDLITDCIDEVFFSHPKNLLLKLSSSNN